MRRLTSFVALLLGGWIAIAASDVEIRAGQTRTRPVPAAPSGPQALLNQYCVALSYTGDVNAANTDGRTALDAAEALKFESVAAYPVDKGATSGVAEKKE